VLKNYPYPGMSKGMKLVLPGINMWRAASTAKQILPQVLGFINTDNRLPIDSPNHKLAIHANGQNEIITWNGAKEDTDGNSSYDTYCYSKSVVDTVRELPLGGETGDVRTARKEYMKHLVDNCSPFKIWEKFNAAVKEKNPEHYPVSLISKYNQKYDTMRDSANRPVVDFEIDLDDMF